MSIISELEQIRELSGGILYPKSVVDFARDESTELHSKFEWDDSEAAESYRIWQARKVIKALVTIIPRVNDPIQVQTYVSMKSDRYAIDEETDNYSGGYRSIIEVMTTPTLRKTLLEEAIEEHDVWERKYQSIIELVDIFNAARTVKQKAALIPEMVSA